MRARKARAGPPPYDPGRGCASGWPSRRLWRRGRRDHGNPFFDANAPLISRSMVFRVEPLGEADLTTIVERALVPAGPPAHFAAVPRS